MLSRFRGRHAGPDEAVRVHGGHTTRPRNPDFERQESWAREAYELIRRQDDSEILNRNLLDAPRLDGSRGFTLAEIQQIRQHIFFETHPLDDYAGGVTHQRYAPSPDMAEAWLRLRRGRPLPEDYVLLEHEIAESRYYRDHPGATYREAHAAANLVANWQRITPDPTYEDFADLGG
ncbi:hypothetical protein NCC78_21190 [Micromonospora phytophila]|uniref:hypothetical protein n=1 Tax=Micromonospora phytophila TaxID=709888 RepID=UPI0020305BEF|nr:hypothetical protein [Micromonospora phytophila]MCM0677185.1 hypothetical protein [Micromonospora phytophila]